MCFNVFVFVYVYVIIYFSLHVRVCVRMYMCMLIHSSEYVSCAILSNNSHVMYNYDKSLLKAV